MNDLQKQYQHLNTTLFSASLPLLPCRFNSRFSKTLGRCQFQRRGKKILPLKIDIQAGLQGEELRKTLIHEMCHVWAMINHCEADHGRWFWRKMTELGYPKGHILASGAKDRWSAMAPHDFQQGERVCFFYQNNQLEGMIIRVNKKSITVMTSRGKWRVSAQLLSKMS